MRYTVVASIVPFVLSVASVVGATAGNSPLRPLVPSELPVACRDLAIVPASAQIPGPDFAAHISVANCLAAESMNSLVLKPTDSSIAALDAAAQPSIAIYDDVIKNGNDDWKRMATAAKSDLFVGMVVRMRRVTNDPMDCAGLEPKLNIWVMRAGHATEAKPTESAQR